MLPYIGLGNEGSTGNFGNEGSTGGYVSFDFNPATMLSIDGSGELVQIDIYDPCLNYSIEQYLYDTT